MLLKLLFCLLLLYLVNNCKLRKCLFQERLDHLMHLWELLLLQSAEKGRMLLFTQKRVYFIRECSEVLMWIADRVCIGAIDFYDITLLQS